MRYAACGAVMVGVLAGGCRSDSGGFGDPDPVNTSPAAVAGSRVPGGGRPLGYIGGETVTLNDLAPSLLEASGGQAIAERVLGELVARRLTSRGITLTDADVATEEQIIRRGLSDAPDTAARLLAELRDGRGLGPVRFAALLQRNAGLRRLVADQVTITDPALHQAFRQQHGPSSRVRLITTERLDQARTLRQRALAGEPFGELAALNSTDPSAAQGGLLSPIRPDDNSYPQAIRTAAGTLEPGAVSEPIALDGGFALVRVEEKLPADGVSFDSVKERLSEQVRRRAERALMEQQARELIGGADVLLLDPTLTAAWERQREGLLGP